MKGAVTQAARDAAADYLERNGPSGVGDIGTLHHVRDGRKDEMPLVQAFAKAIAEEAARLTADEFMSVSITRDGVVTSHNSYDANFDEMVEAARKIIAALQERLDNRLKCPFAAGRELRS